MSIADVSPLEDRMIVSLPNKTYRIIYADPPWQYPNKRIEPGKNNPHGAGGALKHYQTLSLERIKAIPVAQIAQENCMLFLWTTGPLIWQGLEVVKAWGFRYTTIAFVWIKMKNDMSKPRGDGIGFYTLGNSEFCLLGLHGRYWRRNRDVKQVILAPKHAHSEKPAEVRTRIVRLCGDVPRIELFARERMAGWDAWGLEAPSQTQMVLEATH